MKAELKQNFSEISSVPMLHETINKKTWKAGGCEELNSQGHSQPQTAQRSTISADVRRKEQVQCSGDAWRRVRRDTGMEAKRSRGDHGGPLQ
eukprot:764342-Hanusia_phi.AAC.3